MGCHEKLRSYKILWCGEILTEVSLQNEYLHVYILPMQRTMVDCLYNTAPDSWSKMKQTALIDMRPHFHKVNCEQKIMPGALFHA